ncbi:MBL fold metallo-hydrolase [Clostridium sp. YIM B02505]|uniref:MBL fold metallo-hydrolase n=1 Tax=Clostridium yunnanense TaxID=2800325 RepID=A0ABS1ERL4_9CLOT|nr:MBL fold metallo-hydrolase [Clostridium yunnanense]MBK1812032.1 MBL fold metallo-hydrolase [Clostridium yunnanense]
MLQFKIKNLSVEQADCFLILLENSDGNSCNILVDGNREGKSSTSFLSMKKEIEKLSKLDYIIVTHVDNDHIGGILSLFQEYSTHKLNKLLDTTLIYNYITRDRISYSQAKKFEDLIEGRLVIQSYKETYEKKHCLLKILNISERCIATTILTNRDKNAYLTFISPDKAGIEAVIKDYKDIKNKIKTSPNKSLVNKNSISFLLEFGGSSVLFLGDTYWKEVQPIVGNIKNLENINLIKIPHHGASKNNENIIEWSFKMHCKKFIITGKENWDKEHPDEMIIEELNKVYGNNVKIYSKINLKIDGNVINSEEIDMLGGE